MSRFTRRDFMRALGVGAASVALPFARIAQGSVTGQRPIRLAAIITTGGTVRRGWGRRRGETEFSLGPILEPFAELRDRMAVLEGLDMAVALRGPGGAHQRGPAAVLTGQHLLEGGFCGGIDCVSGSSGWAAGPSVDQVLARHLQDETRFGSLELGVRVLGSNNRHRISYRRANEPVPPDDDPFRVYERLFAGAGLEREELERLRRERASVLDVVRGDLDRLSGRLGAEHRQHLDAHLESIRDVEHQLDAALAAGACSADELVAPFDARRSRNYPRAARLQFELLKTAFRCDLTRVSTMLFSGGTSYQAFPWVGVREGHHALSHEPDANEQAERDLTKINVWYAEQIAHFAKSLAEVPDGDGTLLDNTIIFWGNEISKGNTHSHDNMRFLLVGGRNAGLPQGKWLRYGERPHNDLLVTFARALGMGLTTFGHPEHCTGPLF